MNPLRKFKKWYKDAEKNYPFDHTAFNLSTSFKNKPYSRMVLLKKILPDGFVFFTNINSNKGKHFKSCNDLSMCFYWENLKKQIRVVGKGRICDENESDEYFSTRVRGSQIEHGHQNNHLKLSVENICWINLIIFQKNLKIKSFQDRSIG